MNNNDLDFEDESYIFRKLQFKFEDCETCKFKSKPHLYCEDDCDFGESYEYDTNLDEDTGELSW